MTVMELVEELKKLDQTMIVAVEREDINYGWIYEPVKLTMTKAVRMTELKVAGMKPAKKFMGCCITKPNAFEVCVLR